jgi:hypothetical protein
MRSELPVSIELFDRPKHSVIEGPQGDNQWPHDGICFEFVQRYIKGEIYILVAFRVRREPRDFATLLKRSATEFGEYGKITVSTERSGCEADREKTAVLVDVVEFVHSPETIFLSSVWIQPVDDLLNFILIPHNCPSYRAICFGVVGMSWEMGKAVVLVGLMASCHAR